LEQARDKTQHEPPTKGKTFKSIMDY